MYLHAVLKQQANFIRAKDVVAHGAGHAVRSIVAPITTPSRVSVYRRRRTITTPSAVRRRRDSRKRTIVAVGTLDIVLDGGRRSNRRQKYNPPVRCVVAEVTTSRFHIQAEAAAVLHARLVASIHPSWPVSSATVPSSLLQH